MKREEMAQMLNHFEYTFDERKANITLADLAKILSLARLGASVAAPTEAEVTNAALAIANQIRRDYDLPTITKLPIDAASNELRRQARAALSALRESKP